MGEAPIVPTEEVHDQNEIASEVGHQREVRVLKTQNAVHCTRNNTHDAVHCTVGAHVASSEEGQDQNKGEALTIPSISRKSPDFRPRPEGATTIPEQKVNPNGGRKLGSRLSITNTSVKVRKSKKHKINPDKFKQMTLKMISTEAIKSPGAVQTNHSFDQSKAELKCPEEEG